MIRDRRDGMSKEGSGRVAVMRSTGLLRSYTLECNYNTGRVLNPIQSNHHARSSTTYAGVPPKYSPLVFEDCGHKLGMSIYDLLDNEDPALSVSSNFPNLNCLRTQIQNSMSSSSSHLRMQQHHSSGALHSQSSPNSCCKSTSGERFINTASTSALISSPEVFTKHIPLMKNKIASLPRLNRKSLNLTPSVDAENQEPSLPASKSPEKLPKVKKKDGSTSRSKCKHSKHKLSPKKSTVSRTLFYSKDSGESSCFAAQEQSINKLTSSKHSLTTSVCFTPNISFKLSIAENAHNVPKIIKKLGGKKQLIKNLSLSTKKLKTSVPFLRSESVDLEKSHSSFSPRSPLASVCEPQPSQSSTEPSVIGQPKSPTFAKTSKTNAYSSAKKPTFKSVSKAVDRLPLMSSTSNQRMKLFPKKVKKKVALPASQTSLQWILSEPLQVAESIEPPKLKIKKRKKSCRKSL